MSAADISENFVADIADEIVKQLKMLRDGKKYYDDQHGHIDFPPETNVDGGFDDERGPGFYTRHFESEHGGFTAMKADPGSFYDKVERLIPVKEPDLDSDETTADLGTFFPVQQYPTPDGKPLPMAIRPNSRKKKIITDPKLNTCDVTTEITPDRDLVGISLSYSTIKVHEVRRLHDALQPTGLNVKTVDELPYNQVKPGHVSISKLGKMEHILDDEHELGDKGEVIEERKIPDTYYHGLSFHTNDLSRVIDAFEKFAKKERQAPRPPDRPPGPPSDPLGVGGI